MDKCGICLKPAGQLFETGKDGVYACFKCQPLVPEVTIGDNDTDQAETSDSQPSKNEEGNSDTTLYCGICHKTFQKNMQLQNHLRNHRAERRFVCTYCNKAFSQSNNLRAHLRIHTNERPYKCSVCRKAFTQVTNLNNHVRLHTGERPFVCPEPGCSKAYAQVTNLNQHRKRHENGRPVETTYDCTVCGEQFQQRNHMYTHRRDAHADLHKGALRLPVKRHMCHLCDLTLPSVPLLQQHMAEHALVPDDDKESSGSGSSEGESESGGDFACVFRSCGQRFPTPRAHTEHLLRAHQLRVLAARAPHPPRRGRPPKTKEPEDPLEEKEPEFQEIKIVNAEQFQFFPKIKVQSMFQ